ncbi:MAG TPA: aldehyde dehydrogenase family protein [Gammaproteobacteria bacterium]|nr:aldehyde dehydrogenase family protein [Gammaproteobacteria bacterium]
MSDPAESTAMPGVTLRNPATGELLGHYPWQSTTEVRAVLQTARGVQPGWAALTLATRQGIIRALRHWLMMHMDETANTISDCVGKTRMDALATEVMPTVAGCHWYEKHAPDCLKPRHLKNGSLLFFSKHSILRRVPWGVVGIISPWNYPLGIPMHEIVPALLAGNTIIFKTSPETVSVGTFMQRMFRESGLPDGVFNHIHIDGPAAGDLLLEPGNGVDKLFFTGSVSIGKLLMQKAASTLTPVSLELGGKDAMIVCVDADLERAADGAVWAGLSNAGQICAGVERIYVHQDIYADFMQRLTQKVTALRVGHGMDTNVDVGPLCTNRQVDTVQHQLEEAFQRGATVVAKAGPAPAANPHFISPMVLTHVDHGMAIMREETFGPVLGVMPVTNDAEAVRLANDSHYGLSASVWSRDLRKAAALAEQIRVGSVMINDHLISHGMTETPWGGFKDTGNDRGHGHFAFEAVTTPQVIVNDWLKLAWRQPFWMPYDQHGFNGLKGLLTLLYGRGILARLAGLRQAWSLLPRMFGRH